MLEIALGLFDTTGFVPRSECGAWTHPLMWLHIGGDLFIWLAYLSIPLILLYFVRRRDLPFPRLFVLFALFILACGFGHFIEALMFKYPLYRLAGVWKAVTAVVSWATVLALIPVVPRALNYVRPPPDQSGLGEKTLYRLAGPRPLHRTKDYILAILAAVMALLLCAALDLIVEANYAYVLSLLAVVFVSWQCGFAPGIVTLLVSMFATIFFFIQPRYTFVVEGLGNQLATAMFFFCGVCCAGLGEAQRVARRRAKVALDIALERRYELEAEVARRREFERTLRLREAELTELNRKLAAAQEQTAETLAQLDAFLDNAPVGIAFYDTHVRYKRVNPYLAAANGRPARDHIGRRPQDIIPTYPEELIQVIADAARPGAKSVVRIETIPDPSGKPVRWRANVFPVRRADGSPLGVGVIREDVTEREQAADALRESEERFRSMADSVPALIWLSDLDRRRTYFNKTWLEFTGRTIEQELGNGWTENVHPLDRERYLQAAGTAFETRRPFEIEYRLGRRDGVYRWVLARGTPRFTPSGAFAGFVGLCLDVTDRRIVEQNLRQSEARYRTLSEAIPQIVWNTDKSGEVTYFNRRWLEYTELPVEAAHGRGWMSVVHPEDRDRVYTQWRTTVENEASNSDDRFSNELRLRNAATGDYRWFLSVAVPLRHPDGTIDQWIGAMADIHDQKTVSETLERMVKDRTVDLMEEIEERKKVELQLRAVATELERSNSELEQFAYIASHDLQEPLRKIQTFGDRLRVKYRDELPEHGREYVDRMHESAGRMRRLIDDLLHYSRVTTTARPFRQVNLAKMVPEVVNDLDQRIEQAEATIVVGELPEIDADPTQMRQLFQNLISNAVKFHKPNVPPRVEIRAELVSELLPGSNHQPVLACRITVSDNGIGFDEKYLGQIFQVFQRLHGRSEYEGTGVGLAICRKIAARHGGTITARSRIGEGAAFVITLPVRQPREDVAVDVQHSQTGHNPDGGR